MVLRGKYDQPHSVVFIGNVSRAVGEHMNIAERFTGSQLLYPITQLDVRIVVAEVGQRPVRRHLGQRRLGVVPIPRLLVVEVSGLSRQVSESVAEHTGALAGLDTSQHDAGPVDSAPINRKRGRPQIGGAGHPPAGPVSAQVLSVPVKAQGKRPGAVHISVDDRFPPVVHVPGEFRDNFRRIHRNNSRHDHQRLVISVPQLRDDTRHQPQDPAGALEPLERRPVLVEAVEELRMDGIGGFHPPHVVSLPRL